MTSAMYSVVRFQVESEGAGAVLPEIARGLGVEVDFAKRERSHVSVELCSSGVWADHEGRIGEFVRTHGELIRSAVGRGIAVEVDTAIEPEDLCGEGIREVWLSKETVGLLGEAGVAAGFSIYVTEGMASGVKAG